MRGVRSMIWSFRPSASGSTNDQGVFTPPPVIGFFNQMKQEYVSARFILYEGLQDTKVHFSDRGVQLFDTLDYPAHSLATERVRAAFRIAYSLLDKAAYLVDHYWKLGKIADRINFKNVWMVEGKARLLERFKEHPNWPLRGLFWLSKELFDDELKRTTAPDAQELHDIRNALEHKYFQVHEGWAWSIMRTPPSGEGLGLSVDSDLLEAKALRVMKIARSALIQLAPGDRRGRRRSRPGAARHNRWVNAPLRARRSPQAAGPNVMALRRPRLFHRFDPGNDVSHRL